MLLLCPELIYMNVLFCREAHYLQVFFSFAIWSYYFLIFIRSAAINRFSLEFAAHFPEIWVATA